MTSLRTLTKQALEEFRAKYTENDKGHNSILEAVASWEVEEWYTSTITRLLGAEIERLEGMKLEGEPIFNIGSEFASPRDYRRSGYNTALDDHITYLKAELAKIKEI